MTELKAYEKIIVIKSLLEELHANGHVLKPAQLARVSKLVGELEFVLTGERRRK